MATEDYHIATVNPKTRFGFCDAVNGVAVSTDYALQGIYKNIQDDPYQLPVATNSTRGGVKIGSGFTVYNDGNLEVEQEKYVLPPASNKDLGGIIAGHNIDVDDAGAIHINKNAFDTDIVDADHLKDGAVTNEKFADLALSLRKFDLELSGTLAGLTSVFTGAAHEIRNARGNVMFKYWINNNVAMIVGGSDTGTAYSYDGFKDVAYAFNMKSGEIYELKNTYEMDALAGFDVFITGATRNSKSDPSIYNRYFFWIDGNAGTIKFSFIGPGFPLGQSKDMLPFYADPAIAFKS